MGALRVLVWNTKLLPAMISHGDFDLSEVFGTDIEQRANAIVDMIAAEPDVDIVLLNEVFSDEARELLVIGLRARFPKIVAEFGPTNFGDLVTFHKFQDSGLMLLSRHPLKELGFEAYQKGEGPDALSNKGAGLVQVRTTTNLNNIVVALTHLQADYERPGEHSPSRRAQLGQLVAFVDAQVNADDVVLLGGDLNVVGGSEEWKDLFSGTGFLAQRRYVDRWHKDMPSSDAGYTSSAGQERLDYVALRSTQRELVAQHIRVRRSDLSDHFALIAHLNPLEMGQPCTPQTAKIINGGMGGREDFVSEFSESLRWVRFDRRGHYVFAVPKDTAFEVYSAANLSDPLPNTGMSVDLAQIPGTGPILEGWTGETIGHQFVNWHGPLYVRVVSLGQDLKASFLWYRKRGASAADAIQLQPQGDAEPFPAPPNEKFNDEDEAWFYCPTGRAIDGSRYQVEFKIANGSGREIEVRLLEQVNVGQFQILTSVQSNQDIAFKLQESTKRDLYLVVRRTEITQDQITVRWLSGLCYLVGLPQSGLAQHLSDSRTCLWLRCDDETDADWLGDDEIVLDYKIDTHARRFPTHGYLNFNTGVSAHDITEPLGFVTSVTVTVTELEDLSNQTDTQQTLALPMLDQGNDPQEPNDLRHLEFRLTGGDVHYTFHYGVARTGRGGRMF